MAVVCINKRVLPINSEKTNDIEVRFDGKEFTETSFQIIQQLPEILAGDDELEIGSFELDIFEININKIKPVNISISVFRLLSYLSAFLSGPRVFQFLTYKNRV